MPIPQLKLPEHQIEEQRIWDVVIVGAGLSGLVCAQKLQAQGYQVLVLEKSRGVGGRMATRRIQGVALNHGVPYLTLAAQQPASWQAWVQELIEQGQISCQIPSSYIAPQGINTLAKTLATGLEIWRCHLVEAMTARQGAWQFTARLTGTDLTSPTSKISSRAALLAIPAPQALPLCQPAGFSSSVLQALQAVTYDPCLALMAIYSSQQASTLANLSARELVANPILSRVFFTQRFHSGSEASPTLVCHSTPAFAQNNFDAADLRSVATSMLEQAGRASLTDLTRPETWQIQRWRYAQPQTCHPEAILIAETDPPCLCCGDWCAGLESNDERVASALVQAWVSGEAAAAKLAAILCP